MMVDDDGADILRINQTSDGGWVGGYKYQGILGNTGCYGRVILPLLSYPLLAGPQGLIVDLLARMVGRGWTKLDGVSNYFR